LTAKGQRQKQRLADLRRMIITSEPSRTKTGRGSSEVGKGKHTSVKKKHIRARVGEKAKTF